MKDTILCLRGSSLFLATFSIKSGDMKILELATLYSTVNTVIVIKPTVARFLKKNEKSIYFQFNDLFITCILVFIYDFYDIIMLSKNMDKLALCRICLAKDIPMLLVKNKCLQEMYEVLTKIPFVTDDCRPMLVCYICCERLHNSYKLTRSCLRSEQVFQHILSTNACLVDVQHISTTKSFCLTEVVHVSCIADEEALVEEQSSVHSVEVKEDLTKDVAHCRGSWEGNAMYYLEPRYNLEFKPTIDLQPYDFINNGKTKHLEEQAGKCNDVTAHSLSLHADVQQPAFFIPLDSFNIEVPRCHVTADEKMKMSEVAQSENVQHDPTQYQKFYGSTDLAGGSVTFSESGPSFAPCINPTYEIEIIPHTSDLISPQPAARNTSQTSEKSFECNVCNKSFSSKYNLVRHSRSHTSKDQLFECDVCKKCIKQKVNFLRHVRTHTTEKPFECHVCYKRFKENISLTQHYSRMHTDTSGDTRKHLDCNVCNKTFKDNSKLLRHVRTHTGERPFECDVCYKRYSRNSTLVAHYATHSGDKTFECDVCHKRFATRIYLVRHSRCHSEDKAYQCDICKKCLKNSDRLTEHLRMHSGEKPFECHVCLKRYSSKRHLAAHIKTHNTDVTFECEVCGKRLTNKYNLARHARSHNQLKTFACDICTKTFRQNYQLARHIRRHTGESAVECGVCGKRCSTKYSLAEHARAHTGERPFECDACAKRFRTRNHLITHLRVHERRLMLLEAYMPSVPETEQPEAQA